MNVVYLPDTNVLSEPLRSTPDMRLMARLLEHRAAIDAVSRWRYLPTTLNGVAVPVIMTVTVSFKLGSGLVLQHFSSVDKHVLQSSRAQENVAIQDLTT